MQTLKTIAVYCGSSAGNSNKIIEEAQRVGRFLAENDLELVYGAGKIGIMGEIAEAALQRNGRIIGVIPDFLKHKEIVHLGLSELYTTSTMHERKMKMYELSDAFIVLPGGFGTMDEFFEILTWAQLGLHQKPIGLLNIDGYYDDLLAMFLKMVSKKILKQENMDLVLTAESIESLYSKMQDYQPKTIPKWLAKDQT